MWAATSVVTEVQSAPHTDLFHSSGTAVEQLGWKVLDVGGGKPKKRAAKKDDDETEDEDTTLPAGLAQGQPQQVLDTRQVSKKTRPPPRLTDATLLTAMETAGRTLDEKELSDASSRCSTRRACSQSL